MKYTKGFLKLGLPDYFKFGIELEAFNVKTIGNNSLYGGLSAKYIKSKNWHMASRLDEYLVVEGGAELVSPILKDSDDTWKDIADICEHIKKFPDNKGDKVVTNDKCGLHVHFDSECLAKYPYKMRNFLRIYAEAEEILYKMCNDKNDPIRKGAINRNMHFPYILSAALKPGMASPTGKKLLKKIQNGTLKLSYKKFGKLKTLINVSKCDYRRSAGLNLTNIGSATKNTIEFRMANGTLDPEVIKQTIFLYASLIHTSIRVTENPELYLDKLSNFFRQDVSEEEKANSFLDLIMDDEENKKIYMDRWASVKDAKVFAKNDRKGFAKNRFTKEQFKKIAIRTPSDIVHLAYTNIKNVISRDRGNEEIVYGR